MRVGLLVQGSRGDVQPFLALARQLEERGHTVELAVPPDYVSLASRAGLRALPRAVGVDTTAAARSEELRPLLERGDFFTFARLSEPLIEGAWEGVCACALEQARACDVLVAGPLTMGASALAVEAVPRPFAVMTPIPGAPTGEYASPLFGGRPWPWAFLNRASHRLAWWLLWSGARSRMRAWRKARGMPTPSEDAAARLLRPGGGTFLGGWDAALVPQREPHPNVVVTGQWAASGDLGAPLSPSLDAWLAEGPPPVYVGFGSMPVASPERALRVVEAVTARLGQRALVVASATEGFVAHTPYVRVEQTVDHRTVLPRCTVAVHHGGAGTTHAALRAGLPSVVCPVLLDQFFWAWRVEALGAGTSFRLTALDEARLTQALEVALRPSTRAAARDVASRMRDDGVEVACRALERLSSGRPPGQGER